MKRHIQEPGIRKWSGQDLVELQSEPLKVLESFFSQYILPDTAGYIISGCRILTNGDKYTLTPGLVIFSRETEDGARRNYLANFEGAEGVGLPGYLELEITTERQEGSGEAISENYECVFKTASEDRPDVIMIKNESASPRFLDLFYLDNDYRFVEIKQINEWNAKPEVRDITRVINSAQTETIGGIRQRLLNGNSMPFFYDHVVRTDEEFAALSVNQNAVNVLVLGSIAVKSPVKIPANIKNIHGNKNSKITFRQNGSLVTSDFSVHPDGYIFSGKFLSGGPGDLPHRTHSCSLKNINFNFGDITLSPGFTYFNQSVMGFDRIEHCTFNLYDQLRDSEVKRYSRPACLQYCSSISHCTFHYKYYAESVTELIKGCCFFDNCEVRNTGSYNNASIWNNSWFFYNCDFDLISFIFSGNQFVPAKYYTNCTFRYPSNLLNFPKSTHVNCEYDNSGPPITIGVAVPK